ncbi:1,2-phenylacetyl-CoA epoxidase subunit PaaD [Amorphus orientalis]|uniref:Ring-1,2-phenylacetyl-CoA epoxidase subunit PaaD n=1 Tax=Amorphus orientalis TaxID=649198 RepID=A0AAE3VMK6_9HYPH|nr:1,2-phenylacetyl-CoA epoxidase subunit PaaD [Amorphus orientalis]MDQ0314806.1 ring-1,2-phenylacetyl-CoA epoxidase subunit PaaD [Amorphus orientalis]
MASDTNVVERTGMERRAWQAAATVTDPEIPVLTIADLGVLRDVHVDEASGAVTADITPTYSGCPAMNMIAVSVDVALRNAGFKDVKVNTVLSPAWTTDWLTEEGREKLKTYGIAPPSGQTGRHALFGQDEVQCPHCGSEETERLAEFGSTACKALWRCTACGEPFDYFKCH